MDLVVAGAMAFQVFAEDAPAWTGAGNLAQIDRPFLRLAPDRRGCGGFGRVYGWFERLPSPDGGSLSGVRHIQIDQDRAHRRLGADRAMDGRDQTFDRRTH